MLSPELEDPCYLLGLIADELDTPRTEARDLMAITLLGEVDRIVISTRAQPRRSSTISVAPAATKA